MANSNLFIFLILSVRYLCVRYILLFAIDSVLNSEYFLSFAFLIPSIPLTFLIVLVICS